MVNFRDRVEFRAEVSEAVFREITALMKERGYKTKRDFVEAGVVALQTPQAALPPELELLMQTCGWETPAQCLEEVAAFLKNVVGHATRGYDIAALNVDTLVQHNFNDPFLNRARQNTPKSRATKE